MTEMPAELQTKDRKHTERGSYVPSDLNPKGYENLNQFVDDILKTYADRPAYTHFGTSLTYADLDRWSAAFAAYIQQSTSLKPGDRIAIQLPNLIQYPIAIYGALRAGLVIVNTNPLYTPGEMLYQYKDSGAKCLLIHSSMAHKAQSILAETDIESVITTQVGDFCTPAKRILLNFAVKYIKRMERAYEIPGSINFRDAIEPFLDKGYSEISATFSDTFALQYTGGTTGVVKGAVLTHANLLANILQGTERMRDVQEDWPVEVIAPLPLYHIYAFTVAQIVAAQGGHSILIPNPRDMKGFVKELKCWQPTTFIGLNTLFIGLATQPGISEVDFSRLRVTLSGGVSLSRKAETLWHKLTGKPVMDAYGLTEASPAVTTTLPTAPRVGSIGIPLNHTECRVVKPDMTPVAIGEKGELLVSGPQVMREYWNAPEQTKSAFSDDGFLKTGDIVIQEPDGYLHIIDRAKDLIIVSGFNVYPTELEDKIADYPGVKECAVVGIPDEVKGEFVRLFVVPTEAGVDTESLALWCKEQFAAYKRPQDIQIVTELPKSPVGKVLRRALR